MADLATEQDLTDRLGRDLTEEEAARASALLADASALVREHTGRDWEAVAGDTVTLRPVGVVLRLPHRPVTALTSVSAVAPDGFTTVAMSGWSFDGIDKIDLTYAVYTADFSTDAWRDRWPPDTYQVVYDHDADVPAIVVKVVCDMVIRTLLSPSMTAGMVAERIGAYNYQLQQGAGAAGARVVLDDQDEKALKRYGPRRAGTIQVEAG